MGKKNPEFPVGYSKPPLHTRFQPGQSGNPGGRPKKTSISFTESFNKELNTRILVTEGGKQQRITKRDAIVKQQTNKAVQGDPKAAALVIKAIEQREVDRTDNLSPVLHAMRAIHAQHEMANHNGAWTTDVSCLTGNATNSLGNNDDET